MKQKFRGNEPNHTTLIFVAASSLIYCISFHCRVQFYAALTQAETNGALRAAWFGLIWNIVCTCFICYRPAFQRHITWVQIGRWKYRLAPAGNPDRNESPPVLMLLLLLALQSVSHFLTCTEHLSAIEHPRWNLIRVTRSHWNCDKCRSSSAGRWVNHRGLYPCINAAIPGKPIGFIGGAFPRITLARDGRIPGNPVALNQWNLSLTR